MNGSGDSTGQRRRGIPSPAILLGVVACFVLIGAATWLGATYIDREAALENAEGDAATIARLLEEHAEGTLDAANLMLAYLAQAIAGGLDPAGLGGLLTDWAGVRRFSETMPQLGTIWIFAPDGQVLFSSAPEPTPPNPRQELAYFATTGIGAAGVFLGRLQDSPQGAFFTMAKGIAMPQGIGAVVAAMSAEPFVDFYRSLGLAQGSFAAMVHRDGGVIATAWPSRLHHAGQLLDMVAQSPNGTRWIELGGADYVLAWRQLHDTQLTVLAALAESDALAGWYGSLQRNGLMILGALGILAAITWLALGSLRREEQGRARLAMALRDKEMLLKELHHRVKNNLQVVTSLITMQSLRFPQPELQESFRQTMDRVRAMGLVHELLYRQEISERLDFGSYLAALLTTLAESYGTEARGIAVSCEADPGAVDLTVAIPAALIVNELLTNALKYAFPEGHAGHVRVTFRRDGEQCRVVVADDGVGVEGPTRGTGLGTLIVKNLVAQLSADYSVETSSGAGTRVSISFRCVS